MSWIAVGAAAIGAAGSLYSSSKQSSATKKGIKSQERAAAQSRADLMPFAQAGQNMLTGLSEQATRGLDVPLERAEGFNAIQNSSAAGGKLHSGGTLKGLTSFNNMLNARNNNMIFNQMYDVSRLGANAAAGQATNAGNSARGIAESYAQQGNAQGAGIMGAANALSSPSFLDYIKGLNNTNAASFDAMPGPSGYGNTIGAAPASNLGNPAFYVNPGMPGINKPFGG